MEFKILKHEALIRKSYLRKVIGNIYDYLPEAGISVKLQASIGCVSEKVNVPQMGGELCNGERSYRARCKKIISVWKNVSSILKHVNRIF